MNNAADICETEIRGNLSSKITLCVVLGIIVLCLIYLGELETNPNVTLSRQNLPSPTSVISEREYDQSMLEHLQNREWSKAMKNHLNLLSLGSSYKEDDVRSCFPKHSWYEIDIAQPILAHLTEKEARSALLRLQQIIQNDASYEQRLQKRKQIEQEKILRFFYKYSFLWHLHIEDFMRSPLSKFEAWTLSRRHFFTRLLSPFEEEERRIKQSYRAYLADRRMTTDPITQAHQALFEEMYFDYLYERHTCMEMLKLRLALRAYFAKRDVYPTTLQELVTAGYLQCVPADAFASDGKFRYKKEKEGYLLYSVGPDTLDDNGTPVLMGVVSAQSRGDIVVGQDTY